MSANFKVNQSHLDGRGKLAKKEKETDFEILLYSLEGGKYTQVEVGMMSGGGGWGGGGWR